MQKFAFIRENATKVCKRYGYTEALMNIVEHEELFQRALGQESEIMSQKEMYQFKDLSERSLVLRPEGTAGVARMFLEHGFAKGTLPKKYFYCGPMFRYEKPQKGRYRQFYQFGIECLGGQDVSFDIETIMIANEFLTSLNQAEYFQIEINSLGNINDRKKFNEALSEYLNRPEIKSRLSEKNQKKSSAKNLLSLLDSKDSRDVAVFNECPIKISDYLSEESKSRYEELKAVLNILKIKYVENPALVRGLEYYNDLCFEIKYTGVGEMTKDTLLGGGRYDFLINDLQGKDFSKPIIPAIGFACGIERLMLAIENDSLWKNDTKNYKKIGITMIPEKGDQEINKKLKIKGYEIQNLFKNQHDFIVETGFQINRFDKQIQYFDKKKYDFILILGSSELHNNQIKVKNLQNGKQETLNFNDNFVHDLSQFFTNSKL